MITKRQAMTENDFHLGDCIQTVGKRGAIRRVIRTWRRNGRTKTWATRPNEFEVPVKYGIHSFGYIRSYDAESWHLPEDCPILKEKS